MKNFFEVLYSGGDVLIAVTLLMILTQVLIYFLHKYLDRIPDKIQVTITRGNRRIEFYADRATIGTEEFQQRVLEASKKLQDGPVEKPG